MTGIHNITFNKTIMDKSKSLQDQYAKPSICYGCGPNNPEGLQIKSYVDGNRIIAQWQPKPHHHAFPDILNGGVIGTLLDCHCNWAAAYYLMQDQHLDCPPCTVTAEYRIKLLKPTPMKKMIQLEATLDHIEKNRATINGKLIVEGQVCDTCQGVFVAVNETHPAFHRW
jgi:acyl-coenzyme A thioesterase PaaI-like protein